MTFDELNDDQRDELKQRILMERNEQRGEGTSYEELSLAYVLVSDGEAKDWAEGMVFSEDDFTCSASEPNVGVRNVPQWAVNYLVNADSSGLSDEDRQMVDKWILKLAGEGLELLCPIDGSENEFCSAPAFGLACGTVDFVAAKSKED